MTHETTADDSNVRLIKSIDSLKTLFPTKFGQLPVDPANIAISDPQYDRAEGDDIETDAERVRRARTVREFDAAERDEERSDPLLAFYDDDGAFVAEGLESSGEWMVIDGWAVASTEGWR